MSLGMGSWDRFDSVYRPCTPVPYLSRESVNLQRQIWKFVLHLLECKRDTVYFFFAFFFCAGQGMTLARFA